MNDAQQHAQDRKLRELYRKSRSEQPSLLLDKRVRRAAEREVRGNTRRWLWGLSTAATFILSFSVVLQIFDGSPDAEQYLRQENVPSSPSSVTKERKQNQFSETESLLSTPQRSGIQTKALAREAAQEAGMSTGQQPEVMQDAEMFSLEVPAAASLLDSRRIESIIPSLPQSLPPLLLLDESVSGEQDVDGTIRLFRAGRTVLTLSFNGDDVVFRAWQGSDTLGVVQDWSLSAESLADCRMADGFQVCRINQRLTGYFVHNRLDHIGWTVPSD